MRMYSTNLVNAFTASVSKTPVYFINNIQRNFLPEKGLKFTAHQCFFNIN